MKLTYGGTIKAGDVVMVRRDATCDCLNREDRISEAYEVSASGRNIYAIDGTEARFYGCDQCLVKINGVKFIRRNSVPKDITGKQAVLIFPKCQSIGDEGDVFTIKPGSVKIDGKRLYFRESWPLLHRCNCCCVLLDDKEFSAVSSDFVLERTVDSLDF